MAIALHSFRLSLRETFNNLFNPATGVLTVGTCPTLPSTLTLEKKVTSGTIAVQLVTSATPTRRVTIQAFANNTNVIAIGGSNVMSANDAAAIGIQLSAGDT